MSLLSQPTLDVFNSSLERCRRAEGFLDRFYERFLENEDDIQPFFEGVDFHQLKRMVYQSMLLVVLAAGGSPHTHEKLRALGVKHTELGVRREHYSLWLATLLSVVEEVDPRYSTEVDDAWRAVMSVGIRFMTESLEESDSSEH